MSNPASSPLLTTQRLTLRPGEATDIPAIIHYYQSNAQHFARTDPPRAPRFYTEEFWQEFLARSADAIQAGRSLRLFLFPRESQQEIIGNVEFSQIARGPFQACYLGYGIAQKAEGQGFMYEALLAGIDYVFTELNLHRVMANHLPENERSARLLKRLGFAKEALARDYLFINGHWRDHVLNALINHQWKNTLEG